MAPGPLARRVNLTLPQLMQQVLLPLLRYHSPQVPHPETGELNAWRDLHWQQRPVVYTSAQPLTIKDGTWLALDAFTYKRHIEDLEGPLRTELRSVLMPPVIPAGGVVSRQAWAAAESGHYETWVVSTAETGGWRAGLDWALAEAYQAARPWVLPAGSSLKDFTAALKREPPRRAVVVLPPQKNDPDHPPAMEMVLALGHLLGQPEQKGLFQPSTEVVVLKAPEIPTPTDAPPPLVMDAEGNWPYRLAHRLQPTLP